jgi:hypothetical protein
MPPLLLKIMLFCSGHGNAPYRPDNDGDVTQWWNRRDALVRCVAAAFAFFGNNNNVELLLYFPDDQTVLHMHIIIRDDVDDTTQRHRPPFLPSERNVIGLWKRAARRPGTTVRDDHSGQLSCRLDQYGSNSNKKNSSMMMMPNRKKNQQRFHRSNQRNNSNNKNGKRATTSSSSVPDVDDDGSRSKRDILLQLQQMAPLEFLRDHRLNSSIPVLLRKQISRLQLLAVEQKLLLLLDQPPQGRQQAPKTTTNQAKKQKMMQKDDDDHRNGDDDIDDNDPLATILRDFLFGGHSPGGVKVASSSSSSSAATHNHKNNKIVYAVTLHESAHHELPCWDGPTMMPKKIGMATSSSSSSSEQQKQQQQQDAKNNNIDVCLFLGAVRDMTEREKLTLRSVIVAAAGGGGGNNNNKNDVVIRPLVVRLGPVVEFTSKILTVAGFHHYHNRLVGALDRLLVLSSSSSSSNNHNKNNATTTTTTTNEHPPANSSSSSVLANDTFSPKKTSPMPTVCLHYILFLDIASTDLTCDLAQRHYSLWCLVRCVVVALWRSKLGGGGTKSGGGINNNNHTNVTHQVTICYTNGRFQTLTPELLVPTMAQAHQAAPSEYQILHALLTQIPMLDRDNPLLFQKGQQPHVDHVIDFTIMDNNNKTTTSNNNNADNAVVGIDQCFYDPVDVDSVPHHPPTPSPVTTTGATATTKTKTIAILLPINERKTKQQHSYHNIINPSSKRAAMMNGNHLIQLPPTMMDRPATLITLVQHLAYQNRLLPLLLSSEKQRHAS